jgi:hypothetical protein
MIRKFKFEAEIYESLDLFFIQPSAIADEVWHLVHQDRSAWSFNVEVRPFQGNVVTGI